MKLDTKHYYMMRINKYLLLIYYYPDLIYLQGEPMGARRNFRRGERAPKRPPSRQKRPPPKKKIVLAPFLGGSEACSPEKKLTVVLPTTF